MSKLAALLARFVDIPATEADRFGAYSPSYSFSDRFTLNRLAAWGIHCSEEVAVEDNRSVLDDKGSEYSAQSDQGPLPDASSHHPPPSHPGIASSSSSAWKMPSDITWPDPHEPGALPQEDFRNARFKLVPLVTEGPWIM